MKKIAILLPYANPHVMGWIEEFYTIEGNSVTIGCVDSVNQYRNGYFQECDFYDSVNYFFKSKKNNEIFLKSLKDQDCFISLGIFSKSFFKSIFFVKKKCQVFILSEPFLDQKVYKNFLYKIWVFIILTILRKNEVSFLAIGGEKVKECYSKIGFVNNDYFRFGYFPKTVYENSEKIGNKLVFLFVGQLIKRKGIDVLIQSIEYISSKYKNWEFNIAGSGELAGILLESIKNNEKVNFLGLINDKKIIDSEYLNADILFLPSYFDGWGAVVNEALSKSCSLLVSEKVYAVNGLLQNGKNGFTFNPYDFNSLKIIFDNYFTNPEIIKNHQIESKNIYIEWNERNAALSLSSLIESKVDKIIINNINNNLLGLI